MSLRPEALEMGGVRNGGSLKRGVFILNFWRSWRGGVRDGGIRVCDQVLKMGEMGMMGIEVEKQVIHTSSKYTL